MPKKDDINNGNNEGSVTKLFRGGVRLGARACFGNFGVILVVFSIFGWASFYLSIHEAYDNAWQIRHNERLQALHTNETVCAKPEITADIKKAANCDNVVAVAGMNVERRAIRDIMIAYGLWGYLRSFSPGMIMSLFMIACTAIVLFQFLWILKIVLYRRAQDDRFVIPQSNQQQQHIPTQRLIMPGEAVFVGDNQYFTNSEMRHRKEKSPTRQAVVQHKTQEKVAFAPILAHSQQNSVQITELPPDDPEHIPVHDNHFGQMLFMEKDE